MRELRLGVASYRNRVAAFLERQGLALDPSLRTYLGVFEGEELVGGAGFDRGVVKCAAVGAEHRGEGLLNAVVSRIMTEAAGSGADNVLVFTKSENADIFSSLGFTEVIAAAGVVLLESDAKGIGRFLSGLEALRGGAASRTGAIVMNCNPFTLGHRYLIEAAAGRCDRLIVFVVEEDASVFPFEARLRLVREGTADLPSVTVVPGSRYVISAATFPTYFLKDASGAARTHCEFDLTLFAARIAPAVGISVRFAGDEPLCGLTSLYNETMLRVLPPSGVDVEIVPRLRAGGEAISASRVRGLLADGEPERAAELVPPSTFSYLSSRECAAVLKKLSEGCRQDEPR